MDLLSATPLSWVENESLNVERLMKDDVWCSIPLLNVNSLQVLKDSKLVRFRGMVQDMYDPEYYYEKVLIKDDNSGEIEIKSGKYVDFTHCDENKSIDYDCPECVMSERQTLVVITAPATNHWVTNIEEKEHHINEPHEDFDSENSSFGAKRSLEDDEMEIEKTEIANKKPCVNQQTPKSNTSVSINHILNLPLANREGKVCHVKMYGGIDDLRLNDFCEFVGFLSVDPILSHENGSYSEFENEMEIETHHPPPSLIPRLHCVAVKKMEHNNPLVGRTNFPVAKMAALKEELLVVLTQLLLGDRLAAEYLLYHLLSYVYIRKDFLAIGKFSLNISNIPKLETYTKTLYDFLELLLPQSHYMPMTLENMNDLAFTPKKDYDCNRITSGILQLNSNTHLLLDETKLSAGKLNESGVKAVAALAKAIKSQTVQYDFGFNNVREYDCDIPFLILSEGKSLLPSDCYVPLKPDEDCIKTFAEITEAAKHFLSGQLLNDIRVYLTLARIGKYEIADDCNKMIQDEFVQMRQNENVSGDGLHELLVLSRLICLSEGKHSLDEACWRKACNLESERKSRL